ncbi:MAG: hypothetical protein O2865_08005 [Planctomycetota bacterium]|nr:hypothetical protein [Planctomycetota bacterium]MDA1220951.1 hypothetical protein [Planctomycetota bacterium]
MNKTTCLLALLLSSGAALAQANLVVPAGMANSNPGSTGLAWRNTAFHFQMLYDDSHFTSQGINYPIVISRLQYRAAGGRTSAGGEVYSGITVQMTTSPSDWSAPSTTFANNLGADVTTVFQGNVTCLAAAGTSPNTYIIDIPLATPFVYDPSLGQDLLIDVDAPTAPLPTGVPSMGASSNASHLARRISTTTVGSPTGSLSYFACVVLMDYAPQPNVATATSYGAGCVSQAVSFHEPFLPGTFDLGGTAGAPNSILLNPLSTGYVVVPGSNAWATPTSTALTLGDDELTPPITLPFTFSYPGGSTTDILVCSNGFVYLDPAQTSTSAAGSVAGLLTFGPRLAPLWNDLDPSTGGSVYYDVDLSGNVVYVTWDQVPLFGNGAALSTIQLAMYSDGRVEYRYQDVQNATAVTGWSPGNGARNGGDVDISVSMPFLCEADQEPLSLIGVGRPKLGSSFALEVREIPSAAFLGAISLGFTQIVPGIDLTSVGMARCFQHTTFDATFAFTPSGGTQSMPLNIPATPALAGVHVYGQAIANGTPYTPSGVLTSNGIDLLLDLN